MALISRPNTYTASTIIDPDEVNADFDTLYTEINGNLNEANLSGSISIPNSALAIIDPEYVDAHADNAAEYLTATTPGTTGGILGGSALPNKLADELERLRYRLLGNNHLISTYFTDTSGTPQAAGWVEPGLLGPQLFTNNGFETKTSVVAGNAPDGWTLEGTPTSLVITDPGLAVPLAGKEKKALRVTSRAVANEGFKHTLTGLKASTKYLIGMTYARVSGSPVLEILTTGGLATGDYQNSAATTSTAGTAIAHFQVIVQTATTGADMVVKFIDTTSAGTSVVDYYQVWAYEMKDSTNLGLPHIPMQTATYSTADDTLTNSGAGAWSNRSGLSLSQYIPALGYRLVYEVSLTFKGETTSGTDAKYEYAFRVQQNIDGAGATTVEGPYGWRYRSTTDGQFTGGTITMKYVVENPTPGST